MIDKVKQTVIPFILMLIFNLGLYYVTNSGNYASGLTPHVGIILVSGLIFGPFGAIGSVAGNFLCDILRGYSPLISVPSAIVSFGISYLGYKLWYSTFAKNKITKPKLNNTHNVIIFIVIILICGFLYSQLHTHIMYLSYAKTDRVNSIIGMRYFFNFINSSFIFGIIGIWISNKTNFAHIPKITKRKPRKDLYLILGVLLAFCSLFAIILNQSVIISGELVSFELFIITLILLMYVTKPIKTKIINIDFKSIPEEIMNIFQLTTLFIIIISTVVSYDSILIGAMRQLNPMTHSEVVITMMIVTDIILLIFIIPSLGVLRYIEIKVIEPLVSFSKIEEFIHENEKIEFDGIVDIYSNYVHEKTEIGTLARTYTDLINFNNNYIENIREIEGEKERIKTELDIATKIQASNLPTEAISNEFYTVDGYSHPAKEVGGDFFDYYPLDDENLAIVIGDASGKGVPAALFAMIVQVITKQYLKSEINPSKILYSLNNQICERNRESMFITLWLGIYNKTTKKLIFSNAGHNPPLVKENGKFEYLNIDTGIVLGILEDYEFVEEEITLTDEIVIYTDGITDANNKNGEMYTEERLLNFFNDFKKDSDPIKPLLDDIDNFTDGAEQFDDMTLLYLKIKDD